MSGPSERDELAEVLAEVIDRRTGRHLGTESWMDAGRECADALTDWLAERDRRVAAEALREAAEQARSDCADAEDDDPCSCHFTAGWLDTRADRIERGE